MQTKLVIGFLLVLSFGSNLLLYKWHTEDQLQLQMLMHAADFKPIANENTEQLSLKMQSITNKFLTNEYNLRNYGAEKPAINIKLICEADNGVNCVYFDGDNNMKYYGESNEK